MSPQIAAGSGSSKAAGAEPRHGLDPAVLAGVAAMLIIAKLSGEIFEQFRQPAALGEMIGGVFIGNLTLIGVTMAEPLKTDIVINALAELDVIILLFEVGLEEGSLIFAGIGATLILPNQAGASEPVIDTATFGAVALMVVVTTLVTPPALKWALHTAKRSRATKP